MNEEQFLILASEPCVLGVDPGATNTGWVVIHEASGTVLHSSTIKRPEAMKPFTWAKLCVETTAEAVKKFNLTKVGVEGVEEPNIYHKGKKSVLRPSFLINTAIVAGAYASYWEHMKPVIVRPSKNGSSPAEDYPTELTKTRPKTLDGIPLPGVRNHERSSYDVAVKALARYKEGYIYDETPNLLETKKTKTVTTKTVAKKSAVKGPVAAKKSKLVASKNLLSGKTKVN